MTMTMITIVVCVILIGCISVYCEWQIKKALDKYKEAQTDLNELRVYATNVLRDAHAMYHVLLDSNDGDEDLVEDLVDMKKEEMFK